MISPQLNGQTLVIHSCMAGARGGAGAGGRACLCCFADIRCHRLGGPQCGAPAAAGRGRVRPVRSGRVRVERRGSATGRRGGGCPGAAPGARGSQGGARPTVHGRGAVRRRPHMLLPRAPMRALRTLTRLPARSPPRPLPPRPPPLARRPALPSLSCPPLVLPSLPVLRLRAGDRLDPAHSATQRRQGCRHAGGGARGGGGMTVQNGEPFLASFRGAREEDGRGREASTVRSLCS